MTSDAVEALTGAGIAATSASSFGPVAIDVPPESWVAAHEVLRDAVGFTFFDFLSAADELKDGFRVVSHLADFWGGTNVDHVLVRTLVPRDNAVLPTLTDVYAGANWHERETHEMFGIAFDGHPNLTTLLLPEEFEGHPLRKEFVLASRVAKPWPGAKEPGESDHAPAGAPSRRRTLPPGVPDPGTWGPRPPGSPTPDPLAPAEAAATPARPRRTATPAERRPRNQPPPATAPPASPPGPPQSGPQTDGPAAPQTSPPGAPQTDPPTGPPAAGGGESSADPS
ncbi:NADH-quinone oxidoreductase subunit C [Kribbella aluminosa]|uniref:NADH-quinone oxidoreductase subunit C n=2 Tax=Kribbella aluminosa TaxID=416017 RepID=A0ABS4UD11_9ACTN|nr:NADH-quinone oxidoreductase subunit C [Kribbella aluminosa]MBP2349522.1 NADH-quinone oxidoreductase subunit C [Kribbella aluminosa]